ncbi:hypothetical protein SAMCFNEI73_Ch2443 [Sinorhizobium americanum]|uniref:Uncharacterized protein n=1 Tax=Sinorhizobium americanum TaxID=194963 RepID=A0A1L3LNP7_9HYPH|nr:hypothetical protein SAMCCGM7_Ch2336 [Sinorhizobium americanum CCGM7]APG91722.1 hypothetical protein SAMCFNEI73_Ch2443 [Sinorhizobium americanum]
MAAKSAPLRAAPHLSNCSAPKSEKAARAIMAGGLFETKAMPEHRLLAGL